MEEEEEEEDSIELEKKGLMGMVFGDLYTTMLKGEVTIAVTSSSIDRQLHS